MANLGEDQNDTKKQAEKKEPWREGMEKEVRAEAPDFHLSWPL